MGAATGTGRGHSRLLPLFAVIRPCGSRFISQKGPTSWSSEVDPLEFSNRCKCCFNHIPPVMPLPRQRLLCHMGAILWALRFPRGRPPEAHPVFRHDETSRASWRCLTHHLHEVGGQRGTAYCSDLSGKALPPR